jgi:uncharacterized membrane protein
MSTALKIGVCVPPIAALIVTMAAYLPGWWSHRDRIDLGSFMFTYAFFSVPAAYVLGILPAFVGSALYCLVLTARPMLMNFASRSAIGLVTGAAVGSAWCHFVLGLPPGFYGIVVSGVPAFILAMLWPKGPRPSPSNNRFERSRVLHLR